MRKFLTLFIAAATLLLFPAFAFAVPSHSAKFVIGKASYEADGASENMDAAPFIENGGTYVPVRYLSYALGVEEKDILWDGKTYKR